MENKNILAKLVKIMGKMDRIPKNGRNKFHNYEYTTESDVNEHVRPLLVEEKVILVTNVKSMEVVPTGDKGYSITRIMAEYTFYDAESGESITFTLPSAGHDAQEKGVYKAITGGLKYAILKTLLGVTGDDPERDEGNGKEEAKRGSSQPATRPVTQPPPAAKNTTAGQGTKPQFATPGQKKLVEKFIGDRKLDRDMFKRWLDNRGWIGAENGVPTLNKLSSEIASLIIKKPDAAAATYREWLDENNPSEPEPEGELTPEDVADTFGGTIEGTTGL